MLFFLSFIIRFQVNVLLNVNLSVVVLLQKSFRWFLNITVLWSIVRYVQEKDKKYIGYIGGGVRFVEVDYEYKSLMK